MPARKFIEDLEFDPATFQFDAFKERLLAEIDGDDQLTNAKIDTLTQSESTLKNESKDLKSRLWDATVARQGEPIGPTDSPVSGGSTSTATPVPDSDIFG